LPWFSYNLGGTVHFHTSCLFGLSFDISEQVGQLPSRKKFMEHIGAALVDQEIISVAGSRFYMCILHTDGIVDQTVEKIEEICKKIE